MMRFLRAPGCASALAWATALLCAGCGTTKPMKRVQEDPRAAYQWALDRIDLGKCLHASETLRLLSLEQAGVPYVDSIFYHLAKAYACLGDYALAQVEYQRVVDNYPSSALVDDAAFGLANAQFRQAPSNPGLDQQEAEKAVRTLEDFIAIYPLSDRRSEAQTLLLDMKNRLAKKAFDTGRLYLKLRADSSAMIYFQQLWDNYTESPYAARALWLLAEKERNRQNWAGAVERYEQLVGVYPKAVEVEQSKAILERMKTAQARELHEQADRARDMGDWSLALSRYETLLTKFPNYPETDKVQKEVEKIRSQQVVQDTAK